MSQNNGRRPNLESDWNTNPRWEAITRPVFNGGR